MTATASGGHGRRKAFALVLVALASVVAIPALSLGAGAAPGDGQLRVGHFASGTAAIDEYVDGTIQHEAIAYTQVTPYSAVAPGSHTVALRPAGAPASTPPLATVAVTIDAGTSSTVAAFAGSSGVTAEVYRDDLSTPPAGTAKVRVIHALGSISAVDVYVTPAAAATPSTASGSAVASQAAVAIPAKTPAFSDLAFTAASPYADLPIGSYEVELRAAGTGQTVVTAHDWPVAPNTVASVVVVQGAQGPTFVVLRDAVGAAATPVGAMATGAGGTAHRSGSRVPAGLAWAVGLALAAASVLVVSRRVRRISTAG